MTHTLGEIAGNRNCLEEYTDVMFNSKKKQKLMEIIKEVKECMIGMLYQIQNQQKQKLIKGTKWKYQS